MITFPEWFINSFFVSGICGVKEWSRCTEQIMQECCELFIIVERTDWMSFKSTVKKPKGCRFKIKNVEDRCE